ncbi:uncharacterized protein [Centroberyx affinis]|uniref:uncharacterized protein isoform X2 n=1 Tax=Centroberyx affinis TaxID=166261 RepID=UPI003A5BC19C
MNLCLQATLHERITIQSAIEEVFTLSKCWHRKWDLLLDLFSHMKDYETQTGRSVLPALQSVYQSAPAVWSINLSKRKASLLLEVLKLQSEKKPVELRGCSDEESEVWSFLQCLPFISQLSFASQWSKHSEQTKFLGNLFCGAAEREQQTGEKILELLSSVCSYNTFPLNDKGYGINKNYQCDVLLDLYSHVKDYETQTGRSVLPALQSVYQSAPAVWSINLSERKASLLLEVMKLQSEKKPVELRGCSDEESEVWSFLQCLPYISQLSFMPCWSEYSKQTKFLGNLFCRAAEREQQTGEKILELLSSVCSYNTFRLYDKGYGINKNYQCDFLLDLCSHVKDYETQTGRSVLPALQSVYQSAPAVWSIKLSERKASLLLEVLKLQSEKKAVELRGCSDEESEVRSFLQCLPYISQLSFMPCWSEYSKQTKFLGNLFCRAAEREQQTGEKILELLSSVCSYNTFSLIWADDDDDDNEYKCDFLLDLCSHVKDYETQTGRSVLPALQPLYQSAPTVWSINLSERKASLLLEVLKLQSEKKAVELRDWSDEESEVRSFLQCLPYISHLSCDPGFFQYVCASICVRSREETQQLASLLQLLGFTLVLTGELPRKTCWSVGRVLGLCGSSVDLILTASKISRKGASLVLRHTSQIHSLRLSEGMALLLFRLVREQRVACPVAIEELSLVLKTTQLSDRVLSRVVSSVASLLRYWRVRCLDLTEFSIDANFLMTLILHHDPLTIKLCAQRFQQLLVLIHEIQDKDLTQSFLRKVGGDLTSCSLDWDIVHYLLQQSSTQTITIDLRKNRISEKRITDLLPFLDRILFKSVDRKLLLRFLHCCAASEAQQGAAAAAGLLRSLQQRLDLSCSSCVELSEQEQGEALCLTAGDCRAISTVLRHSSQDTQLNLRDCEVEDSGLDLLFPVLDRVRLGSSKALLLQLVSLVPVGSERDTVRRAESLCRALAGELDLSETRLDQRACGALALILELSEGLTELDLSHCQLTDQLLQTLIPHLHKAQVLDLSHNKITDALTDSLLQLVSINTSIHTVRLFSNSIRDRNPILKDKRFEIW